MSGDRMKTEVTENFSPPILDKLPDDAWLVRPCEWYREEYKDCRSFHARFHQYFVHGTTIDCSQWKTDYDNCLRWRKTHDVDYMMKVIKSENDRKSQRLQAAAANTVWEQRTVPPDDWNKPLPEWMEEQLKKSFLYQKQQGAIGATPHSPLGTSVCVIL